MVPSVFNDFECLSVHVHYVQALSKSVEGYGAWAGYRLLKADCTRSSPVVILSFNSMRKVTFSICLCFYLFFSVYLPRVQPMTVQEMKASYKFVLYLISLACVWWLFEDYSSEMLCFAMMMVSCWWCIHGNNAELLACGFVRFFGLGYWLLFGGKVWPSGWHSLFCSVCSFSSWPLSVPGMSPAVCPWMIVDLPVTCG